MALVGMAILIYRRRTVGPVFSATTPMDKVMYLFLGVVIVLGMWNTIAGSVFTLGGEYNYREGVSVWYRSFLAFAPEPGLMAEAPARVPAARPRRVRPLRPVALHPARARVLGAAGLPHPPLHRLPVTGRPAGQPAEPSRVGPRGLVTGRPPAGAVRGTRSQALWMATVGFFGGFAGVSIFGPLVPKFTDLLDLSPFAAGILAAIPALTGSLLRIPFGAAVDRVGGKRPFLTLLVITNVGVLALLALLRARYPDDMAGTYPLLLLLGVLIGCGIATFSVGIAQVSYWYPDREQGGALGTYAGLGNTSPGLSTMLLPLAVGSLGLLGAYSVWFAVLLAITLGYAVLIKDAPWFQLRRQRGRPARRGPARPRRWRAATERVGGGRPPARGRDPGDLGPGLLLLPLLRRLPRLHLVAADLLARDVRLDPERGRPAHRGLLAALGAGPGARRPALGPDLDQVRAARQLPADARGGAGTLVLHDVRAVAGLLPRRGRRHGTAERDRLQAPAALRAPGGRRRLRLGRRARRARRVRDPAR